MKALTLEAMPESEKQPRKIVCYDFNRDLFAEVFIDQVITFHCLESNLQDLKQILMVAENFNLFYNNLIQK